MFSRMTSRLRDRGNVLRASIAPCIEALEGRRLLSGGAPNAPFALSATAGAAGVQFSFIDSADNETGFVVSRAIAGTGAYTALATLPASTPFHATVTYIDAVAIPGVSYAYEVVAINGAYTSSTPAPVVATPTSGHGTNPGGAPNAPFALAVNDVAGAAAFSFYDSAPNETGFVVERGSSPTGPFQVAGTLPPSDGIGKLVTFTDNDAFDAGTFYYTVYAVNGAYQSSTPMPVSVTFGAATGALELDPTYGNGGTRTDPNVAAAQRVAVDPNTGIAYAISNAPATPSIVYSGPVLTGTGFTVSGGSTLDINLALRDGMTTVTGLAVQADGKILIAGSSGPDILVARFNPNGSLDTSFGNEAGEEVVAFGGNESVADLAVGPNGKIYVGGTHDVYGSGDKEYFAVRFNTDGSLDSSFGYNGISKGDAHSFMTASAIAVDPTDGSVIIVGNAITPGPSQFLTQAEGTRLTASGNATDTFSFDSGFFGGSISDVLVQADRKIVVAGGFNFGGFAKRFNPDGTPDSSWVGPDTSVLDSSSESAFSAIARASDGTYFIVGSRTTSASNGDGVIAHLNADGSVIPAGGTGGYLFQDRPDSTGASKVVFSDVAIAPGGSIYAAGGDQGSLLIDKFNLA